MSATAKLLLAVPFAYITGKVKTFPRAVDEIPSQAAPTVLLPLHRQRKSFSIRPELRPFENLVSPS